MMTDRGQPRCQLPACPCLDFAPLCAHQGTITIALAALLVNSTAAIWTPNYTGRILDAVVHADTTAFWGDVEFYTILCVVTGAFGIK